MIETRIDVPLRRPAGNLREAEVFVTDTEFFYGAKIYLAGRYVARLDVLKGSCEPTCCYPYEQGSIAYIFDEIEPRTSEQNLTPIDTKDDWIGWLNEYVAGLDPRDVFRALRKMGPKTTKGA